MRVLANELDDGVKYLDVLCFVFEYTTLTLFLSDYEDSFLGNGVIITFWMSLVIEFDPFCMYTNTRDMICMRPCYIIPWGNLLQSFANDLNLGVELLDVLCFCL